MSDRLMEHTTNNKTLWIEQTKRGLYHVVFVDNKTNKTETLYESIDISNINLAIWIMADWEVNYAI